MVMSDHRATKLVDEVLRRDNNRWRFVFFPSIINGAVSVAGTADRHGDESERFD